MTTDQVIEFFGSKAAIAKALGCSPAAVTMWGDEPPRSRQWQIQVLTKGKLKVSPPANPLSGKRA